MVKCAIFTNFNSTYSQFWKKVSNFAVSKEGIVPSCIKKLSIMKFSSYSFFQNWLAFQVRPCTCLGDVQYVYNIIIRKKYVQEYLKQEGLSNQDVRDILIASFRFG